MSAPDPNIGRDILDGQFQILQKIGSGGMGAVYKAAQPAMNRMVAVKMLYVERVVGDPVPVVNETEVPRPSG